LTANKRCTWCRHLETPSCHQQTDENSTPDSNSIMLPQAIKFPPYQGHCVKVSAINAAKSRMLAALLVTPAPPHREFLNLAGYSFLIESPHRAQKVLYDLAFMNDVANTAPPALKPFLSNKAIITIDENNDVATVLQDHGVQLSSVKAIVWSHALTSSSALGSRTRTCRDIPWTLTHPCSTARSRVGMSGKSSSLMAWRLGGFERLISSTMGRCGCLRHRDTHRTISVLYVEPQRTHSFCWAVIFAIVLRS
jgi:hypothetical protein